MEREEICMNEKGKYSLINNERGNVLLYCLLIVMVLMVVTPMVMMNVSTERLTSTKMEDNIQVNALASSAMETFAQSLKNGMSLTNFKNYPGWGETKEITLANGKKITLEQTAFSGAAEIDFKQPISDAVLLNHLKSGIDVEITATSGKSAVKTYRYRVTGTSSGMVINSPVYDVSGDTASTGHYTLVGSSTRPTASHDYSSNQTVLKEAITKFINETASSVTQKLNDYNSSLAPNIKYYSGDVYVSSFKNISSGSNPVVIIADHIKVDTSDKIIVYGDIFAKTMANNNGVKADIEVKSSGGNFGNLYVIDSGIINLNVNGDSLIVDNMIYAKNNIQLSHDGASQSTTLKARSIVIHDNFLQVNSNANVTVTDYIAAPKIEAKSNDINIDVTKGDVLASDSIELVSNTAKLNANGMIAAGNKFSVTSGAFTSSGKNTYLKCADGSSIFSGCSANGLNFIYERK